MPGGVDRQIAETLGPADLPQIVSVLSESLPDSPLLRFVLEEGADDPDRLDRIVAFLVRSRLLRKGAALGVRGAAGLDAAAVVSYPSVGPDSSELVAFRDETWAELGAGARQRYESFDRATDQFRLDAAHIHINVIGVRRTARGKGLGRALLEAAHELSVFTPLSAGVTLCTELDSNVALCEHFGYEVVGSARIDSAFATWGMYRRDR